MRRAAVLACVLWLVAAVDAQAGVTSVWAVHDGEKVAPDDRHHPAKAKNAAWDGRRVTLFGARNEIVAFQVIVEADERGIGALRVSLPELKLRGGASRIRYSA